MRKFLFSYKMGSRGGRELARSLGVRRIKHRNSRYRPRHSDVVVNWGSSETDRLHPATVVNANSYMASNKLTAFNKMREEGVRNIPFFTTSYEAALEHISGKVVGRTLLSSHSGQGIVLADNVSELEGREDIKLFLPYIKKEKEYRVHVFRHEDGCSFDVQQKKKVRGSEATNYQVRNHSNGWVYCREDVEYDERLFDIALSAVSSLGLSFGAVDIIYNRYYDKLVVLEVNTAVGLEGQTLPLYTYNISKLISSLSS